MGTTIDSSNTSALASTLFDKLDTKKKGYIDQADLQAAAPNAKDDNSAAVFKALDTDGDGKVSKSELSTAIDKVGEQLNAQRDASRVEAAADAGGGAAAANAAVAASGGAKAGGAHHGGGHGGGHEGAAPAAGASGGASSTATATATKYVAAADTNNDGTVSDAEEAAYEETQAAAALKAAELKAQGQVETYKAVGSAGEETQATAAVDVTA